MAAGGTPANVKLGPGRLSYAPLGTAEPTLGSAALPSAWQALGYTESGSELSWTLTDADIEVAEELDPIDNVLTKRVGTLTVEAAENTKKNLLLVTGGGAANTNDNTPFELPDLSAVVGVMMVWDSADTLPDATNRRILMRCVKPGGTVTTGRKKAPGKATLPAVMKIVKPDATTRAVKYFPDAAGRI